MGKFLVDTVDLRRLSDRIRLAAAEARAAARHPGPLLSQVHQLGNPALAQATADFVGRWSRTLDLCVDDATRLADAVAIVARLHEDAEWAVSRSFS